MNSKLAIKINIPVVSNIQKKYRSLLWLVLSARAQKAMAYNGPIINTLKTNKMEAFGEVDRQAVIRNHIAITIRIEHDTGAS